MFLKIGVLKYFANFIGKHLCWNLLNKVAKHRCFPVTFVKFSRTFVYPGHLWWLLLKI